MQTYNIENDKDFSELMSYDSMHSQFQLGLNQYHGNKNYMSINYIETKDYLL